MIFFLNAETALFDYRLQTLNEIELKCLLNELTRFVKKYINTNNSKTLKASNESIFETVLIQINEILNKSNDSPHQTKRLKLDADESNKKIDKLINVYFNIVEDNMINTNIDEDFSELYNPYNIKIPFEYALNLIRNRNCYLHKSIAYINLKHNLFFIMKLLFYENLNNELNRSKVSSLNILLNDERIQCMFDKLNHYYELKLCSKSDINKFGDEFSVEDIEKNFTFFPLCMKLAHKSLLNTNRLSHQARVSINVLATLI